MKLRPLLLGSLLITLSVGLGHSQDPAKEVPRVGLLAPAPESPILPVVAKVTSADPPIDGKTAFPKMLAEARTAYSKLRDYMGHIIRQERINGTLQAEQVGELRARVEPFCINVKLISPKAVHGVETSFMSGKNDGKVRFKPASATAKFSSLMPSDPKVLTDSLHPITDTGMLALIKRMESILDIESQAKNPVQIVISNYTFQDRPVYKCDVYTERAHPKRYAHHTVLYLDKENKLPVRFEAYDQPKNGSLTGDLIECVSFVNLKLNSGLGESVFER